MSIKQGYIKKEFITNIDSYHFAESISTVVFDIKDYTTYLNSFYLLQDSRKVNCKFEDDAWILYSHNLSNTKLLFDLDMYPDMKLILKCYTVLGISEGLDSKYVQFRLRHLKGLILHTQSFKPENTIEKLESWLLAKSKSVLSKLGHVVSQFIQFINCKHKSELLEICERFCLTVNFIRTLPNFKHTLSFDYIINDFSKKWNYYERIIFYPLLLWWRITLVIPMRVIEFCSLSSECAFMDNNKYYLKIPRKKIRARGSKLDIEDTLQINKELYELIMDYKLVIQPYDSTQYLLSYEAYCESKRVKNHAKKIKINKESFTSQQLHLLITHFYDDIVNKKYNYTNLERINPMDTRHFAFCNMMLQGFNMLTIAVVGGHSTLDAQMHYFSHLEHLSQSSIQYWVDQFTRFSVVSQNTNNPLLDGSERLMRAKSTLMHFNEKELSLLPEMEFGYCTFDPTRCPVGDCRHCEHLYVPPSQFNAEVIVWLTDESKRLETRIKEQLELMKAITLNMKYNFRTFESDPLSQSELSYLATNSRKLREQKARTDTKLNIINTIQGVGYEKQQSR